jgi:hypothetical protein
MPWSAKTIGQAIGMRVVYRPRDASLSYCNAIDSRPG